MQSVRYLVFSASLLLCGTAFADVPPAVTDILDNHKFDTLVGSSISDLPLAANDAQASAKAAWQAYQREQSVSPKLSEAERLQELHMHGSAMRYYVSTIGQPGPHGYPLYIALHAGVGGAPSDVNDGQWEHMKIYYKSSIQSGVYVAPRAISDAWDMHFQTTSYDLYKQLIAQMILLHNVDPDRVYLLGFSAGGDGVYQIATRLGDRLAAASMSAGYPNDVSVANLQHVPLLLQVGEQDRANDRNRITAQYDAMLAMLHELDPAGYIHETFVHAGKGRNFYDNDPLQVIQATLADLPAWLQDGTRRIVSRNTNAIAWLERFARNPLPRSVVWDLTTLAPAANDDSPRQHHWLDIGQHTADSLGTPWVEARIDRENNTIYIAGASTYLKLWLNSSMLDLDVPVSIVIQRETKELRLAANLKHQVRSILNRGDPHTIFDAAVELHQTPQGWEASAP